MMDEKLFVGGRNGHLFERWWRADTDRWTWVDHGRPPGTEVVTPPGGAMMDAKLFVGTANSHLFERVWTGTEWKWVDHGRAYHDQSEYVIGSPGDDPKLTLGVMGDGFTEHEMDEYRALVREKVVEAFRRDRLGDNLDIVRVIRIDVASPVAGVTERTYNERGTIDPGDDTLAAETYRFSRLGFVATDLWSHCWLETSPRTFDRIDSIRRQFAPAATNIIVLVNTGTGGGCNRGDVASFTKGSSVDTVAHELGHNLFDLGDEYNNDDQHFTGTVERVNLSGEPATWDELKWGDHVGGATPLPTDESGLPGGWNNRTNVGAFEGGGAHYATGIFRPVLECRMNQNSPPWCPICGEEIDRITAEFR